METNTHKINFATEKLKFNLLNKILNYSIKNGYSFSMWKMPNNNVSNGSLSFNSLNLKNDFKLEELGTGFILSPFDNERKQITFSPSDILLEIDNSIDLTSTNFKLDEFLNEIENISDSNSNLHLEKIEDLKDFNYQETVEDIILKIEEGEFQKVVLARSILKDIPNNFNPIEIYFNLLKKYPSAFVSLTFNPEFGLWIGATPELLIEKNKNNIFKTVSIAGTKIYTPGSDILSTEWQQKEIEEQALVSRYIVNQFKKIRVREFDEIGPTVTLAGNLIHLKTEYTVNLNEINFNDLPTVMLKLLHPTPAVCGDSKEKSFEYILENEKFERELYSGFLGPVNFKNETNIFVNLRCMKIHQNVIQLFAGAGITKNSDPEKEFFETEAKFNTILSAL